MYRILLLALGSFAIGTDTFVVAGVLPEIVRDLNITVDEAGQTVTVFAVTFGVLSPILAALTAKIPRRTLLLISLALFGGANVLSVLAPSFGVLLLTRVLAGAGASMYTPVAAATAAALAPPERRGRALALVLGGTTAATVLGVPVAAFLGSQFGWRVTFGFVAVLAIVALAMLATVLPTVPLAPIPDLGARMRLLVRPDVLAAIATTFLFFVGGFTVYTYIAPALMENAGVTSALSALLLLFGIAGVIGNWLGGYLTDRLGPAPVLIGGLSIFAASILAFPLLSRSVLGAAVGMVVWAVSAWSLTVPQQHRLMSFAPQAPMVAIGLNSSAVFLGIGVSGVVGALGLQIVAVSELGYIGGFLVLGALVVAMLQFMRASRIAIDAISEETPATGDDVSPAHGRPETRQS